MMRLNEMLVFNHSQRAGVSAPALAGQVVLIHGSGGV